MTYDGCLPGFWGLYNAVTNASGDPISQSGLVALVGGAPGDPSQRRTLFSDVSWSQLVAFADAAGISSERVLAAYEQAREEVAAANPEIDALIADDGSLTQGGETDTV